MRHSLHSHILYLENRIQFLRDRLTMRHFDAAELQEIERQLVSAELALVRYQEAYALEISASGPEMPGGSTEPDSEASGHKPPGSRPPKSTGRLAAIRVQTRRAPVSARRGVLRPSR